MLPWKLPWIVGIPYPHVQTQPKSCRPGCRKKIKVGIPMVGARLWKILVELWSATPVTLVRTWGWLMVKPWKSPGPQIWGWHIGVYLIDPILKFGYRWWRVYSWVFTILLGYEKKMTHRRIATTVNTLRTSISTLHCTKHTRIFEDVHRW
jgi:hypothetical protein